MANDTARRASDWAGSAYAYGLVWGLPVAVMVGGLLVDVPARMALWTTALIWKGLACIVNARRCHRTHCRFTGPFYLAMIIPVLALGSGAISVSLYGWLALGVLILLGSKIIWWATERAWGKFS
jgi:hypothetical protein